MRIQLTAYINTLIFGIIVAVAALTPLIFSNLTTEFFEIPKLIFLVVSVLLLLALWSISWVVQGKVVITRTPLDLPLILILAVVLLSTFFSPTRNPAIFGNIQSVHGSAFSWVAYILFYFIVTSNIKSLAQIKVLMYALLGSTVLTTVISLISYFGIYLPLNFAQIQSFNPTGSSFSANYLIVIFLPVLLSSLLKPNKIFPQIVALVITVLFTVALALTGNKAVWIGALVVLIITVLVSKRSQLVKGLPLLGLPIIVAVAILALSLIPINKINPLYNQRQSFPNEIQLSFSDSWKIAASAFTDQPFLGTGPDSFLFNYTQYKPATINLGNYWNIRFDTANNEFLQFLGTLGGLGLMALLFLTVVVINFAWKGLFQHENNIASALAIASLVAVILLALHATTPVSVVVMFLFFAMLMTLHKHLTGKVDEFSIGIKTSKVRENGYDINNMVVGDILPIILIFPVLIFVIWSGYQTYNAVAADYYHRKALNVASTRALDTYNHLITAENLNPRIDLYRVDLAQTNFALANAIAVSKGPSEASPGGSLTDADKANIQTLLSQAVGEGKNAVILSPRNSANWEILASLYRQISGVAENAMAFSLDSYGKAVSLDPMNPVLRLNIGGVYYSIKNYDLAIRFFDDAIKLKPDYQNAYYNLAVALREKGNLEESQLIAEKLVSQLQGDTTSPDYKVAADFLSDLKARIATGSAKQSDITAPAAQQNGALQNQDLPNVNIPELENKPEVSTPAAVKR
jgi:O-antigen ligase/tetratricopeptide (TPR) repeat protein